MQLSDLSPKDIAAFIIDLYINFVRGTTPHGSNPFHGEIEVLSGSEFEPTLLKILEGEDDYEEDEQMTETLKRAFEKDQDSIQELDEIESKKIKIALISLLRSNGYGLLHQVVSTNNLRLVEIALSTGLNVEEENESGITPLAFALELQSKKELNYEKIIELLLNTQEKRKKRGKTQLPGSWQEYKKYKVDEEWLTDVEVNQGLMDADLHDTHIIPALDIINNPDLLAETIRDNYLNQIQNEGGVAEFTIIPINFNNAHWATLVIRQNQDRRSAPAIYFFDSMGEDDEKIALIRIMLEMTGIYTAVDNVTDFSKWLQDDGYTCGTWMIESATKIVRILQNGGDIEEVENSLELISVVVKELHRQNLKLAEPEREKKNKSESSMKIEDKQSYHVFGNGIQEYSEQWIEESYDEFYESLTSLEELAQTLMVSFEEVDSKMKRIYLGYLYKIYHELSKDEEIAELFKKEINKLLKFIKAKKSVWDQEEF